MTRYLLILTTCAVMVASAIAQDAMERGYAGASDLRVLLVANNPEAPKIPFADMANPRTRALYRERTGAWESLLRYHFKSVRVVLGEDYVAEMSNDADVTIFDTLPKALTKAVRKQGEYTPASYLPVSFDRPALTIAQNSATIGEPMGLKLDWM